MRSTTRVLLRMTMLLAMVAPGGAASAQADVAPSPRRVPTGEALLELVSSAKAGVVQIVASDESNMKVASGSGFYLDSHRAIVGHQVAVRSFLGRVQLATGESVSFASIAAGDPGMNLALIEAPAPSHLDASHIKVLPLSDEPARVKDEILLMSMPANREQVTVSKGTISGEETIEGIGKCFRLDVAYLPGSAGSPVINHRGEVVAVTTFVMHEDGAHYIAVPAERIRKLVKEADDSLPVKLVDYRRVHADSLVDADGIVTSSAEDTKLEATVVTQEDGSMLVDDRYVLKGSGTKEDPYRVTWDQLVSAGRVYRPREGRDKLPERVTMLNDKFVRITGYVAFPLMVTESNELLLMLNQWDGCCIGVPPTPYDAVEVTLSSPIEAEGGINIFNYGTIEGKFKVDPFVVNNWLVGLYLLEDAKLELELTP